MDDLTITLTDDSLLEALSEMARAHGQTLDQEVDSILRSAAEERARRLALVRRAQEISAMTPKGVLQTDSTILIREARDR